MVGCHYNSVHLQLPVFALPFIGEMFGEEVGNNAWWVITTLHYSCSTFSATLKRFLLRLATCVTPCFTNR